MNGMVCVCDEVTRLPPNAQGLVTTLRRHHPTPPATPRLARNICMAQSALASPGARCHPAETHPLMNPASQLAGAGRKWRLIDAIDRLHAHVVDAARQSCGAPHNATPPRLANRVADATRPAGSLTTWTDVRPDMNPFGRRMGQQRHCCQGGKGNKRPRSGRRSSRFGMLRLRKSSARPSSSSTAQRFGVPRSRRLASAASNPSCSRPSALEDVWPILADT